MAIFAISFVVFLLSLAGLAIGVVLGRRGITGSCGGLNRVDAMAEDCPVCGRKAVDLGQKEVSCKRTTS